MTDTSDRLAEIRARLDAAKGISPGTNLAEKFGLAVNAGYAIRDNAADDLAHLLSLVDQLQGQLDEFATLQDRIPDDGNGDWGLGWDNGYNAALSEVRAMAARATAQDRVSGPETTGGHPSESTAVPGRPGPVQGSEVPDVDGWTIYPTTDGGLMVSHDTDADRPTLAADDSIPLAAVLAFIADADEETPEPAEPTLRDIMAAAYRARLGIHQVDEYELDTSLGEPVMYREWSITNPHKQEVGRLTIRRARYETFVQLDSRRTGDRPQVLTDPTPADILAAAREAGLIGDTDA